MPLSTAASTMEPVEGPNRTSSSKSRSSASAWLRSKADCDSTAWHSFSAQSRASRPTASSVYWTTTWKTPSSSVAVVRLKVTGQPAWFCKLRVIFSRAWAMLAGCPGRVPSRGPTAGKMRRNFFSKSLPGNISRSSGAQRTMASMLV